MSEENKNIENVENESDLKTEFDFNFEEIKAMSIYEKLFYIGAEVEPIIKKPKDPKEKFSFSHVTSDMVLIQIKKLMIKYRILIMQSVLSEEFEYFKEKKNCFYVKLKTQFDIVNIDNPKELILKEWTGHGSDSGERCVGKANTYLEKYFILKLFNVPTPEDDPDSPKNQNSGNNDNKKVSEDVKTDIDEKIEILKIFFYQQSIKGKSKEEIAKLKLDKSKIDKMIDDYCKEVTKFGNKPGIDLNNLRNQAINGGKRLNTTYDIQSKVSGFQKAITSYDKSKSKK